MALEPGPKGGEEGHEKWIPYRDGRGGGTGRRRGGCQPSACVGGEAWVEERSAPGCGPGV